VSEHMDGLLRELQAVEIIYEKASAQERAYIFKHAMIQDLRRKDFVGMRSFRDNEIASPRFLDTFVEAGASMDPLNAFLAKAMGLPWLRSD